MWFFDISNNEEKYRKVEKGVWKFFMEDSNKYGFEERLGQQDMGLDIAEAIRDKEHILIEAGVGIGKSFAYIVPILYYNKHFKKPAVIATSTITLQEQLVEDIRKISRLINYEPNVVLAKGMTHFVCKRRAFNYYNTVGQNSKDSLVILEYIKKGTGDRKEIPVNIKEDTWNKINVEAFKHSECKYYKDCYFMSIRDKMKNTNGIIICNQDLLIAHQYKSVIGQRGLLSERLSIVVIDEAHNLEGKVRNSLMEEWGIVKIEGILNDSRRAIRRSEIDIGMIIIDIKSALKKLFVKLDLQIQEQVNKNDVQLGDLNRFFVDIYDINENASDVNGLLKELNEILDIFAADRLSDSTISALEELEKLEKFLSVLNENSSERLFWLERRRKGYKNVRLYSCPKHTNEEVEKLFFNDNKITTILTSATMTNNNDENLEDRYSYFIRNTNFPTTRGKGFLSIPKDSPYPYDEHAIIYYNEFLPHPTKEREKFIEEGTKLIVNLLEVTNGKALILFTAKSDLEQVYTNLLESQTPWKILKQQEGSSQEEILEEFRNNINSVLLGTGAFWEGISIEGKELSNLIVFRLPFPVPDPIIEYKNSISENPLMEVSVPEMIIKLKQGIGRLIRNYSDKGIVSILDSRLGEYSNSPYKDVVWESLPIKRKTSDLQYIKEIYESLI